MTVPSIESNKPVDNSSDAFERIASEQRTAMGHDPNPKTAPPLETKLWSLARAAESQSVTFSTSGVKERWIRAIKAVRNEHFDGSKYLSDGYKHRSKLFRPKTRSALRKKLTNMAHAFFSTGDVISVQAIDESNQQAVIGAAVKQELMNYRLSRTSRRNGIRWFQTLMGAGYNANVYGCVLSKQSWRYRTEPGDGDGDEDAGKDYVLEDRPYVDLIKPENVRIDINCDWTDPAQSSPYVGLLFPMMPDEAWALVNAENGIPWKPDVTFEMLTAQGSNLGPSDTTGTRAAREGNKDPVAVASADYRPIWLTEWFIRYQGVDYCFWALGNNRMISEPRRVREAYPFMHGERPLVFGVGALEPHRIYPMSPVDSWQQVQQEINDQVNLRLDHMKKAVDPPAKVKRGANVDIGALKTSGPGRSILMTSPDDVEWMAMPDLPQSAYVENNLLNADMDDLAGIFNGSSVATNRDLNETVGGMRLMAGTSDAVSEFDLTVFVETWAEPVLWQVLKLEEMYESDVQVLMLCGEKAQLWQKYGVDAITDEMLKAEAAVSINLGVGASSLPEQKLQKFAGASKIAMEMLQPFVQGGIVAPVVPNCKAVIDEVYGAAGFKDAADRFFVMVPDANTPPPNKAQQPDPKLVAAQMKQQTDQQKMQLDGAKHVDQMQQAEQDRQMEAVKMQQQSEMQQRDLADRERQREADRQRKELEVREALVHAVDDKRHSRLSEIIGHVANRQQQRRDHMHQFLLSQMDHSNKLALADRSAKARASSRSTAA